MAVKVFLTGATGYIGGTVLDYVYKAHPDYEYTLYVRNESRAKPIKAKYPKVNFVYGALENSETLLDAVAKTDVVIHTADSSDNVPGATAIAMGLEQGHTPENPGYWIHLCGTSILTWYDQKHGREGEPPLPEQTYSDIDDVERLVTLPDSAHHRNVDILVQETISDAVKVAIICPPTIYGEGLGPVNTRSIQVPNLAKTTLKEGYAPVVGKGETEWDNVHVDDLADLFVKLLDATQDPSKKKNPEIFGLHGYFFASNGVHKWSEVAQWILDEAAKQGYHSGAATKTVSLKQAESIAGPSASSLGRNSKGIPQRAEKYLGWKPKGPDLKSTIAATVTDEAKALNLKANKA
ncbi:nucleoside-diphosphate-sugar epimerase, putative [Cordyceps militaris CM01]|uniref:Nucleoside-diphosphate-sugar epimerase, putative n=1 Tax=Cordyceps militaris (strain CM01) TaxID=983644 RepID=G3JJZ5_CORMM|nr:nucleoside-diphosphate-sugar epimerase, putative [Cordyceps militaris CM01]EGX91332.1 nucleoside-diphosphate-sugar epimerase, putative [Cordyceps militaris CM01]